LWILIEALKTTILKLAFYFLKEKFQENQNKFNSEIKTFSRVTK
jgi:hypothetical protein